MRNEIVKYMTRLYATRLTTSLGGNISCKADDGTILITPSSIDKAALQATDIVVLDQNGEILSVNHKPSMEFMMHVQVYKKRPDIRAVIHAHPFYSTLFSASDRPININYTSEACKNLKQVLIAEYKMMGTLELAEEVANKASESNIILMRNHGVLTAGQTLMDAFYRMEILEQAAKMTFCSSALGLNELSISDIRILSKM